MIPSKNGLEIVSQSRSQKRHNFNEHLRREPNEFPSLATRVSNDSGFKRLVRDPS